MIERQLAFDEIRNIITTKKANNWNYIIEETKRLYGKDISNTLPIFLTPNDFLKNSPIFDPGLIFFGWFRFNKTPVLILNSLEELENTIGKSLSDEFLATSHFIV